MVIKEWPSNKSPGPDGFTGEFYKAFIEIIIPDLHTVFKQVMEQGTSLQPLNSSFIVLMPKKENATKPHDYRPISLIHAVQRIFSKILANRIQEDIKGLVDCAQTGFVKERQITEGFLYAQQILQHATKK